LLPFALALAACAKNQGPDCGGTAPVAGTWEYHGLQSTPLPGDTLVGTVTVSDVSGCEFSGSMSVDQYPLGGGSTTVLAGTFFGVAVSSDVINFDATLNGGTARTHVAQVIVDSMSGTWVEGTGAGAPRGTFWARRTGP
jgi:hypothetical protein